MVVLSASLKLHQQYNSSGFNLMALIPAVSMHN